MENFLNETANLGTTGNLSKATKRAYQGQTITDMRKDIVSRAEQTIEALYDYQNGVIRAPMARSIRNGLCVKIGYGKRNVGFFQREGNTRIAIIPDRKFSRHEAFAAAAYLKKVIEAVNAGEFDELLSDALYKLKMRFQKKRNLHRFAAE